MTDEPVKETVEEELARQKKEYEEIKHEQWEEKKRKRALAGWVDGRTTKKRTEHKLISIYSTDAAKLDRLRISSVGTLSYAYAINDLLRRTEAVYRYEMVSHWLVAGSEHGYAKDIEATEDLIKKLTEFLKTEISITAQMEHLPKPLKGSSH